MSSRFLTKNCATPSKLVSVPTSIDLSLFSDRLILTPLSKLSNVLVSSCFAGDYRKFDEFRVQER